MSINQYHNTLPLVDKAEGHMSNLTLCFDDQVAAVVYQSADNSSIVIHQLLVLYPRLWAADLAAYLTHDEVLAFETLMDKAHIYIGLSQILDMYSPYDDEPGLLSHRYEMPADYSCMMSFSHYQLSINGNRY